MKPVLFDYNMLVAADGTVDHTMSHSHGLGDLYDCTACIATLTSEGDYTLEFEYPCNGVLFDQLQINRIVVAKANHWQDIQAFRIISIGKQIKGLVKFKCQHVAYDMANVPVKNFKDWHNNEITTVPMAISAMVQHAVKLNPLWIQYDGYAEYDGWIPYEEYENLGTSGIHAIQIGPYKFDTPNFGNTPPLVQDEVFKMDSPTTLKACLFDGDNSIRGCWGGDIVYDNWDTHIYKPGVEDPHDHIIHTGVDRGVVINYGIDMVDVTDDEDISEMVTGVLPYYKYNYTEERASGESEEVYVYGDIQYVSSVFPERTFDPNNQKIVPIDVSGQFPNQPQNTAPEVDSIERVGREYIQTNDIGSPAISLKVKYAYLGQDVRLYDTITVKFPRLGIDKKARVTSYKYDVLANRPIEVEIGKAKSSNIFSILDASKLFKGLIPPKRIKDGSITHDKLGAGSVGGSKIATGGVKTDHIQDENIVTEHIKPENIINRLLQHRNGTEGGAVSEDTFNQELEDWFKKLKGVISRASFDGDGNLLAITLPDMYINGNLIAESFQIGGFAIVPGNTGHGIATNIAGEAQGHQEIYGSPRTGYTIGDHEVNMVPVNLVTFYSAE